MGSSVYVKNISYTTSEKEIKEFFSFCGKITKVQLISAGLTQNATVIFEKETAAKTALLLDRTSLGKTQISVSSASTLKANQDDHNGDGDSDEISQEQKPRSRIVAEYLAHGYAVSDVAVQRAIDLDEKHGVSAKFMQTLQNLNAKTQATTKAKSLDQSYGITEATTKTTNSILQGVTSFYEKAAGTPTGHKIVDFYTQSQTQVADIHREARRLADMKKEVIKPTNRENCMCGSTISASCVPGACTCSPGACACVNCCAVDDTLTKKTTCKCGGDKSACSCKEGSCTCSTFTKADKQAVPATEKTTCSCGGGESSCKCVPGTCTCSPGACACASCCAVDDTMTKKTTCKCGGDKSACSCKEGSCTCSASPKVDKQFVSASEKIVCSCGGGESNCTCAPGMCGCSGKR